MQKWILAITLLVVSITGATAQSYDEQVREYISQYKDMAIMEQQRSGIPAAITLAQGIHETSAGASQLATMANNHFGIKCKKDWTGETFAYTDDAPDECFRKYSSAKQSYKDHSDYLSRTPRYAALFTLSKTDYASWAFGLRKCGYATNPRYAQVLIKLIEDYRLQEFTYAAMDNNMGSDIAVAQPKEIVPEHDAPTATITAAPVAVPSILVEAAVETPKRKSKIVVDETPDVPDMPVTFPPYGDVVRVNRLKAVYAKKGDMPLEYALKTNIRYEKLLEINDISDRPLAADMYLYLEKKHTKGLHSAHVVKEGETIAQVSQYEGVSAKTIRSLNKLEADDEPAAGTTLQLQTDAEVKPATIAKAAPATPPAVVTVEAPVVAQTPPAAVATQPAAPIEENTLAGNTNGAEPSMQVPPPPVKTENTVATAPPAAEIKTEPATATVVPAPDPVPVAAEPAPATPTDIGPAKPADVTPPAAEVVSAEKTLPNPPPAINIANEKPIEEVIAAEKKNPPAPPAAEEPKDELDALKAKFDKVVYSRKITPVPPPATAPEVKTETPAAPVPQPEVKKELEPAPVASAKTGARFYVVKKGDTAFSIAKKNNITMHELVEWNKLDFEAIKVGQRLRIQP